MNFLEIAKSRYTTKKYDASQIISEDIIQELKEILVLSPSSINSQPWKFVFISDPKIKEELGKVSFFNEPKILAASHVVVFTAIDDISLFESQIKENLPEGAVGYYNEYIKILEEHEIKAWLRHQVYLSGGFFLSACASMSIDATPMEGIISDEYDKILQLNGYKSLFAVAIGSRDVTDTNQPSLKSKSRLPLEKIVESL